MTTTDHPPAATGTPAGFAPLQAGGPYIQHNGPLYLLHQGDVVKFGFRVEPRHTNPMGNLHGGMMASFCDMLLPLSVHRKSDQVADRFLPTISLQIDYLAPAPLGAWVEGEAEPLRVTRSLVFAQGLVTADGVPCARVSGVFKIGPAVPSSAVE
ncbi:PaaI family thioesterase [Acidovorax sp. FJL06]|uniref:PaaI family thioesterase n=1 Tax=Acidovorax sp. FJL06 TaxID=2153365 RepID=UPI000F57F46A|nr:PaaI family thioesterase [Acidovorax sp. FJL06]RQO79261.1 PaaI family thioesterase [Acidovorax sp. FJL06]